MKKLLRFMVIALFAGIGISLHAQPYNFTTAQTCNATTGGTTVLNFPGTPAAAASDATLTLTAFGDIDSPNFNEYLQYFGETGPMLGQSPAVTQCSGIATSTFTIPLSTISAWAATGGSIDITVNAGTGTNSLGGACLNSAFCVTGTLTYASVSGPNDAGVSALTSPTLPVCAGTYPVTATIQNYGSNTINPVSIGWSINGTAQTGASYTSTLDTINGSGSNTASISLGSVTIGTTPVTIKAWTSNPNSTADTINANDTIEIVYAASLNGTYTIGSTGADFSSVQAAVTALDNFGVCGPVVFHLDDGTYNESIEIGSISGVSTVNTITFKSDPSNTALAALSHTGTSANNYTWRFNGAEHIILDSFEINANGTTYGRAIEFLGSNDSIMVQNCEINGQSVTTTSTFMSVIYNNTGTGNLANNVTFQNNTITGGSYQTYWYGGGTTSLEQNCKFINNTMTGFYYQGLYLYYQNNVEVIGNTIENAGTYSFTSYVLYRRYCDGASSVIGNTIINNGNAAYSYYDYYCDGTAANPQIIANNFIRASGTSAGGTNYGIFSYYANHNKFYHNNISMLGGNTSGAGARLYYSSSFYTGNEFVNNIISSEGNTPNIYIYLGSSGSIVSDNNAFYYPNTTIGYYGLTTYTDLSALQTGSSTNANSLVVDPIYTDAANGDLHIANTSLNGVGSSVGILDDIDGQVRTTSPDIGADEITVPDNDVAAYQLLNPSNPFCGDSANVEVVIGNFGLDTLTSASVNWTLNGTAQTTFSWTGSLLSTELDTINLGNTAFSNGDELVIWTTLPNGVPDSNTLFDTISISIMSGLSGAYSIPGDFATITGAVDTLNMIGTCDTVWFNIANGSYDEAVTITEFPRNNAMDPVVFKSANADSALVTWTTTTENTTITLSGADYIWIEDLTLTNTNTSGQKVVELNGGASYNMITRSHLVGVSTSTTSNLSSTIYNSSGIDGYNTISDNLIENGSYGIYNYGSSTTDLEPMNTISGNTVQNFYYQGIYNYYQEGLTVNYNTVTTNSSYTSLRGIYNYYTQGDIEFVGNHVYPQAGTDGFLYAMYFSQAVGNDPFDRDLIANNILVAGRPGETGSVYALYMANADMKNIYHNTCIAIDGGTFTRAVYVSGNDGCDYVNNIFALLPSDSNSTYGAGYAMYYVSGALFESNNNDFYAPNSGSPIYFTGAYSDLAAYQTATGNDMNSYETNPNFIDTLAGILCNDTLDGAGAALSSVMMDIDMNMRNSMTPDIGAREFQGVGSLTLGPDTTICDDEAVLMVGAGGTSVNWTDANNTVLSTGNMITVNQGTTFPVSVSYTNLCGSASASVSLDFVPNVSLDSALHLCADETETLAPDGSGSPNATYTWFPTAEVTSQIDVDAPGVYSVTKSEDGCLSQASITVTQSDELTLVDAEACNANLPFTVDATIFGGNSYNWSGGASTSTAQNDFTTTGDYAITATDSFGCTVVDTFNLEVIDIPVAVIANDSHSSNLFFFNSMASQGVGSNALYFWNFGDGDTSSAANPAHLFPWNGQPQTFTVTLTITNDCGTSETVSFDITSDPLGVNTAPSLNALSIYPNPSNGLITINGEFNSTSLDAQVVDLSGRVVLDLSNVNTSSNQVMLDLQGLAAGSYHVKLIDGANVSIGQIIIQ